jgi:deaminated glutathione amidase
MGTAKFIAAAAQMCATDDTIANLQTCRRLAARAAEAGARLLVLPECFAFLGQDPEDKFRVAERLDADKPGPILSALQDIARTHDMWVIAGGMAEIASTDPVTGKVLRTYISCPTISPSGQLGALYRKIHLFDVEIPGRVVHRESDTNAPGSDVVVLETPLARIGLSVCYDVRFPELYREMAVRLGAQILVVPAAFTAHTGPAHWHVLLRSRAIENQCYVIAAAQYGRHNEKRESYGHSLIIDPWGRCLGELDTGEGLVVSEIDLDELDNQRQQMPVLQHQTLVPNV